MSSHSVFCLAFLLTAASAPSIASALETERASVKSDGTQIYQQNQGPDVSLDGGTITYYSPARFLVSGDSNNTFDVFAYDRDRHLTKRVSVSSANTQGNDISYAAKVSANGRFVAFTSLASNLVPGDTNGASDIFVRDRRTGVTKRISVGPSGIESSGTSYYPAISGDGRFVAFLSLASNLVAGDDNEVTDVFVHDCRTGVTQRVSIGHDGEDADGPSQFVTISADGAHVAFQSYAGNLVEGDSNGSEDVFTRDLRTGMTLRVSVGAHGAEANDQSNSPSISGDGRFVAFQSFASNLSDGDHNDAEDVFVYDKRSQKVERVSVDSSHEEGGWLMSSTKPAISSDGRYVAFQSLASNFAPNDANKSQDIFIADRLRHTTRRISISGNGGDPNGNSENPAINGDGSVIVFESAASNLVKGDSNGRRDIFVVQRDGKAFAVRKGRGRH
jgi:hypothetical protein